MLNLKIELPSIAVFRERRLEISSVPLIAGKHIFSAFYFRRHFRTSQTSSFTTRRLLDSLVTSKTRVKLLLKFFAHSNSGYLRSLAKEFDESTNSVRVELNRLTEAGLLLSEDEGKTKVYRANHSHPFFAEITGMVSKFLGLEDLMEKIVKRMGNVEKAIIVGDYARGVDSGIVELVLIGQDLDRAYLDFIAGKAYEKLKRKVQVTLLEEDPGNIQGIMVFGR